MHARAHAHVPSRTQYFLLRVEGVEFLAPDHQLNRVSCTYDTLAGSRALQVSSVPFFAIFVYESEPLAG